MATLGNPYLDQMMQQASQPMQYQPPMQQQQQQQVQQTFKPQQYAHSYDNKPVMRDGVQYNGTHNMQFGKRDVNDPRQQLGNQNAPSSFSNQSQAMQGQQQQGYNGYSSPNQRVNGILSMLQNGRDNLSNRAEFAMQRTVIPKVNQDNALKVLGLGLDYQSKMQGLQNEQAYRDSSLGIERDRLKMQGQEMQYNQDYRMKSLAPKPLVRDPMKDMESRSKVADNIIGGIMTNDGTTIDPTSPTYARIRSNYIQRGELPTQVVRKDGYFNDDFEIQYASMNRGRGTGSGQGGGQVLVPIR